MPQIRIVLDCDRPEVAPIIPEHKVVYYRDAHITIGTLKSGMASGKTSVVLCVEMPDGKVLVCESSLAIFKSAFGILNQIPE